MKKLLLYVGVLVLILILVWPQKTFKIKEVIDGNTIVMNNGSTVHLIGVSNTTQAKKFLDSLSICRAKLDLIPDRSAFFDKGYIDENSSVYAYLLIKDDICVNADLLKRRYSDIGEKSYLKDSLISFNNYAKFAGGTLPAPTPGPNRVINYREDNIYLDPYVPSNDRKHSHWYIDGSQNLEMLEEVCDYNLPYTKKFANELAARVPGSFSPGQICEIYAYGRKNWSYVNDPVDDEYVASASESIYCSLKGDCDDFAVWLASCILAVGGRTCLNTGFNPESGHAFAEVDISNFDDDDVLNTIREYYPEYNITHLNYRTDGKRKWLNLDWQTPYPGGDYYDCSSRWDTYPYENGQWTWIKLR